MSIDPEATYKFFPSQGGDLSNRDQFVKASLLLMTKRFMNAAGSLRIPQESFSKSSKSRNNEDPDRARAVHAEFEPQS